MKKRGIWHVRIRRALWLLRQVAALVALLMQIFGLYLRFHGR
jgi:hypothetical protein